MDKETLEKVITYLEDYSAMMRRERERMCEIIQDVEEASETSRFKDLKVGEYFVDTLVEELKGGQDE